MVSRMASTCNHYAARCTKIRPEILHPKNSENGKNAPDSARKRRNRVRFGCWRRWERLETGENGWESQVTEPECTPFPYNTCKKKTGENPVFSPAFWQGQKDLNPRHAVLETAALPTELYPYLKFCLFILASPSKNVNHFFEKRIRCVLKIRKRSDGSAEKRRSLFGKSPNLHGCCRFCRKFPFEKPGDWSGFLKNQKFPSKSP